MITEEQRQLLFHTTHIASLVGIFGSGLSIICYGFSKSFHTLPLSRVFLFLSMAYLAASVATLLGPVAVLSPRTPLCRWTGFLLQLADLFAVLWMLFIGLGVYLVTFRSWTAEQVKRLELPFLLGSLVTSTVMALPWALVPYATDAAYPVYYKTTVWCWIGKYDPLLQLLGLHLPMLLTLAFNTLVFVMASVRMLRMKRVDAMSEEESRQELWMRKAVRGFVLTAYVYVIMFGIIWLPQFMGRMNHLMTQHGYFDWILLRVLLTPTRGMANFVMYALVVWIVKRNAVAAPLDGEWYDEEASYDEERTLSVVVSEEDKLKWRLSDTPIQCTCQCSRMEPAVSPTQP